MKRKPTRLPGTLVSTASAAGGKAGANAGSNAGGNGKGNNPEQLLAAGYAACFSNALIHVAQKLGAPITSAPCGRLSPDASRRAVIWFRVLPSVAQASPGACAGPTSSR